MSNFSKKQNILLLMGGVSPEREISLESGKVCLQAIKDLGYRVETLDPDYNIITSLTELDFDIIFNCLHGSWGENGYIQSIFEFLNIKYTHSGILASANAMNKLKSKEIFKDRKIPVARSYSLENSLDKIEFPIVIKPINGGSSVDIYLINSKNQMDEFIEKNNESLSSYFAEDFVDGTDYTCGVIGGKATQIAEIVTSGQLFDYNEKYSSNSAAHIIPANLKPNIYERMREYSLAAHDCLGCRGVTRVDFRYSSSRDEKLVCLEVNTQPGMTKKSLLPELAECSGISFHELIEWIICDASCNR
ncbi:MAG: D-alanine--D-alanine ligase [Pseudomonadota bacterium]|nr:D-alanine--D-alanine ligase [Pseudomonadota bacterium]